MAISQFVNKILAISFGRTRSTMESETSRPTLPRGAEERSTNSPSGFTGYDGKWGHF